MGTLGFTLTEANRSTSKTSTNLRFLHRGQEDEKYLYERLNGSPVGVKRIGRGDGVEMMADFRVEEADDATLDTTILAWKGLLGYGTLVITSHHGKTTTYTGVTLQSVREVHLPRPPGSFQYLELRFLES